MADGPFPGTRRVRAAKEALRAAIRGDQRDWPPEQRRAAALGLREVFLELPHLRWVRHVVLYETQEGQLDTGPLRVALAARSIPVLLPTITRSGRVALRQDTVALPGAPAPGRTADRVSASLPQDARAITLVPGLAVDTLGRRLGRGQDGYDRILAAIGPCELLLCAVADAEVLDAAVEPVPESAHDVPVDAVITPTHLLYLRAPAAVASGTSTNRPLRTS